MPLRVLQLGQHDWVTLDARVDQLRHIIHICPHVVERETLVEYRIERWALERERRWVVGWADTLRAAMELAEAEEAERRRKLNQQPPTHPRGLAG